MCFQIMFCSSPIKGNLTMYLPERLWTWRWPEKHVHKSSNTYPVHHTHINTHTITVFFYLSCSKLYTNVSFQSSKYFLERTLVTVLPDFWADCIQLRMLIRIFLNVHSSVSGRGRTILQKTTIIKVLKLIGCFNWGRLLANAFLNTVILLLNYLWIITWNFSAAGTDGYLIVQWCY